METIKETFASLVETWDSRDGMADVIAELLHSGTFESQLPHAIVAYWGGDESDMELAEMLVAHWKRR